VKEVKLLDVDGDVNLKIIIMRNVPLKAFAKSSPIKGKISANCKARAKKKFKVYPSAYANMWASKCTKGKV